MIDFVASFASTLSYATAIVYWVRDGHLDPLQLVFLGTMVELVYFIAQLPTGVFADAVSRRLSIVMGTFLVGLGFFMQGASATFTVLLLAQVPIGLGAAQTVGAQESWLADETGEDELTGVFLRATQLGLLGTLVGAGLGGLVATQSLRLPFLVSGAVMFALGIALTVVMPERGFHAPQRGPRVQGVIRASWLQFATQLRAAASAMALVSGLVLILGMTFFVGMWGESFDRLWGDYLLTNIRFPTTLSDPWWFALIAAAAALIGLVATTVAARRTRALGPTSVLETLIAVCALCAAAVLAMVLAHAFTVAVIAYLVVAGVRPLFAPLTTGWIVPRVSSEIRATALSGVDLFDGAGQILGGPVVGVIGTLASVRVALLAGAAALAPAAACLTAAGRKTRM